MTKNANLSKARNAKNDEFYTRLSDVSEELKYYKKHFKDKTVFCNCDNPVQSAFWEYFHFNFKELCLKKLISTYHDNEEPVYKTEYNGNNDLITPLTGNGDFRSHECLDILDKCDIVVTNPPFSLFREYVACLIEHDKKFLIIGNINAITYKEFFPLLKNNQVWAGITFNKTLEFIMPDDYVLKGKAFIDKDGKKHGFVPGICWYTNLDIDKRHEKLVLCEKYTPEKYPKYANYDAIEVDKVANIPIDYFEEMGVPITYLDKHNSEQFEIVGISRQLGKPMSEIALKGSYIQGGVRFYLKLEKPDNGICYRRLYDRIVIKHK